MYAWISSLVYLTDASLLLTIVYALHIEWLNTMGNSMPKGLRITATKIFTRALRACWVVKRFAALGAVPRQRAWGSTTRVNMQWEEVLESYTITKRGPHNQSATYHSIAIRWKQLHMQMRQIHSTGGLGGGGIGHSASGDSLCLLGNAQGCNMRSKPRFSKAKIHMGDLYTCQYCATPYTKNNLTLGS